MLFFVFRNDNSEYAESRKHTSGKRCPLLTRSEEENTSL